MSGWGSNSATDLTVSSREPSGSCSAGSSSLFGLSNPISPPASAPEQLPQVCTSCRTCRAGQAEHQSAFKSSIRGERCRQDGPALSIFSDGEGGPVRWRLQAEHIWIEHQAKDPVCGMQEFARDSSGQLRGSQDNSFWNSLSTLGNDLFSSPNPSPAGEDKSAGEALDALCIIPA